jgi:hypothetical protein
MTRYEREQVQAMEDSIQYHESMKRNHDEAIAKLKARIEAIQLAAEARVTCDA